MTSNLNGDNVVIETAGKTYTLKPTLKASMRLDKELRGFQQGLRDLMALKLHTAFVIVTVGAGIRGEDDIKKMQEDLYDFGIVKLSGPCAEYLGILMNGGKRPGENEGIASDDEDDAGND